MPDNLRCSLDQLAFMHINHEAGHSKPLDSYKHILKHFLTVPVNGYVVRVDGYGQGTIAQCTV